MSSGTLRAVTSIVNREDVTWKDILSGVVQRALSYNIIEFMFIAGYLASYHYFNTIHPAALWLGFAVATTWILSTSLNHAAEHAKDMVLHHELFLVDFVSGIFVLSSLAWIVRHEDWPFMTMFLLAATQHLRYAYLTITWLVEADNESTKD